MAAPLALQTDGVQAVPPVALLTTKALGSSFEDHITELSAEETVRQEGSS